MACGDCPCSGNRNAENPDFPRATATPDLPALNVSVTSEADKVAVNSGGFSISSVEWWQWVLVAIAVILLVREK